MSVNFFKFFYLFTNKKNLKFWKMLKKNFWKSLTLINWVSIDVKLKVE